MSANESRPTANRAANEEISDVPAGDTTEFTSSEASTEAEVERVFDDSNSATSVALNPTPLNELIRAATEFYLDGIDPAKPPTPAQIEAELLGKVNRSITVANKSRGKRDQLATLKTLTHSQVADILLHRHRIVLITSDLDSDSDGDSLRIYVREGRDEGIYSADLKLFRVLIKQLNYSADTRFIEETLKALRDRADRVLANEDQDTIAVANGIFDFKTKTLCPFTPDVIFTSKLTTRYVATATNPVITMSDGSTWDVETWIASLSDDPEVVDLLWEIISAVVRPRVSWNKCVFFYSEKGNNGKGTLCSLMTNLVGSTYCPSIPLNAFSKEFHLERLLSATAIVTHENDVGFYVDQGANFKAVVTHDTIAVNRKHKAVIDHTFWGMMIQCVNAMPSTRDKSRSWYRRQLWVPFFKDFTHGERTEIKDDFLARQEVLEYVLHRALHMEHYSLSQPQACRDLLLEVQENNDNVLEFLMSFKDQWVWDLVPYPFLYDLYVAWMAQAHKGTTPTPTLKFTKEVRRHVGEQDLTCHVDGQELTWRDSGGQVRPSGKMDKPELLIAKYDLTNWCNPGYPGKDPALRSRPMLADKYYGLVR
ncbi:MAG: phage/plasmid primase, P4 family [Actinomyces urogenitalis]|uniref:DNA primase family protein n=1 Tax=Actinomyces urogenitalis TaxID=103621 RepID=UPI002A7FF7B3|nr:phage/plasmid primase, P4 family [Actinomyces urogenitalis]MDY3678030.1 phage/plasmid primase, P4 family [Actinomyces urogenitalis]